MDILGQSSLFLTVTAFALAVSSLSRNLRNKLVQAFSILCLAVSGWALFFFLEKVFEQGFYYKFHLIFHLLLAPIGVFFIKVLTRVQSRFILWISRISWFFALIESILLWSEWYENWWVKGISLWAPITLALTCAHLMIIDFKLKRGLVRRAKISTVGLVRRDWIYLGAIVILAIASMDHLLWLKIPLAIPSVGNILLCLYLFIINEAIIHQRLLNLSALLNQIVVLVFISMFLTLIYTVLVAWIENSPSLFLLNTFVASFLILMVIDPLRKLSSLGVLKLFSQKLLKIEQLVEDSQKDLTGVLDTVGLSQLVLQFLEQTLKVDSATLFILRSDGTKFRRIRGIKDENLTNREILASHPTIEFMQRMRKRSEIPILLEYYLENEIDRSTSPQQKQSLDLVLKGMQGLNANVIIPLFDSSTMLGFLATKAKNPPEAWGSNWGVLSVLYPFFPQAARTLKNMDVYVRLREKERLATVGEMAAGLAHEIRNPLGAIKGAAQYLIPSQEVPETQRAFLNVIVEEVNRLNKVVTQFLDYSRPLVLEKQPYNVADLLQKTRDLFLNDKQVLDTKAEILIQEPKEGFDSLPKLKCSPEMVKQVLVNLVQNALNALKNGNVLNSQIVLGASVIKSALSGTDALLIFVEDNGLGIKKEVLDKIFIPFFTTSPTGTGLGLSICQRIIEAHGGRIEVVSEEEKGTRFSLLFPVSRDV